ncbi:PD-(D/E)XK nuclease family protein [bacterium]|nr:PD-(D/E)XK nuclease family protein [bacterium]
MLDWHATGGSVDLPQRLRGGYIGAADELLVRLQAEGRLRAIPVEGNWDELFEEIRLANSEDDWDWFDWRKTLPEVALEGDVWLTKIFRPLVDLVSSKLSHSFIEGEGGGLSLLATELRDLEDVLAAAVTLAACSLPKGQSQSPAAWLAALNAALETVEVRRTEGGEGGGILLGNPFEMRLPELDTVFIAGLSRGSFPPPHRDDPLLRESERQILNRRFEEVGRTARLTLRADRQAEERYLFYIAATRASRRLILSWSVRDLEGRVTPPSFFLDELAHIVTLPAPRFVPGKSLDEKFARPVGLRDLLRNLLIARSRRLRSSSLNEAELFLREQGMGEDLDVFSKSISMESLEDHPRLAQLLAKYSSFSPTGLEVYAHCPYRFLIERILRLEDDEEVEPGAREEGLLYHKVLELFFREWDGNPAPEDLPERLGEIYPRAFDALLKEEAAFHSRAFRIEDPRRLRILNGYLERDLNRLNNTGMRPDPLSLEGLLQLDSSRLPGKGASFILRGRVDRVDKTEDGRRLVIDYKRSSRTLEKVDSELPMSFQLPVYAWSLGKTETLGASFAAVIDPKKPLSGYYRKSAEGDPLEKALTGKWLSSDEWKAWLENVGLRIRILVDEIASGKFDPAPADEGENCERCSVRQLCRWQEGEKPKKGAGDGSS